MTRGAGKVIDPSMIASKSCSGISVPRSRRATSNEISWKDIVPRESKKAEGRVGIFVGMKSPPSVAIPRSTASAKVAMMFRLVVLYSFKGLPARDRDHDMNGIKRAP